MTRIRATCPDCGEVELLPDDVVLHIVRASDGDVGTGSTYRFDCPSCEVGVQKPADDRIAQLLTTGGVPVEEGILDGKPPHPEAPPGGPPLTHDDLLDLHLAMRADDWLDALLIADNR